MLSFLEKIFEVTVVLIFFLLLKGLDLREPDVEFALSVALVFEGGYFKGFVDSSANRQDIKHFPFIVNRNVEVVLGKADCGFNFFERS